MLFALFCLILFSPCLVAFVSSELMETSPWSEWTGCGRTFPRWRRPQLTATLIYAEEVEVAEGFVVRSFPKGLSQRRVLVQDFAEGVRLTIAQVRAVVANAAWVISGALQSIRETRAELLQRLAEQARIALDQQIVREGRRSRVADERFAEACARLRWSEVNTEAQWSEAFAA